MHAVQGGEWCGGPVHSHQTDGWIQSTRFCLHIQTFTIEMINPHNSFDKEHAVRNILKLEVKLAHSPPTFKARLRKRERER